MFWLFFFGHIKHWCEYPVQRFKIFLLFDTNQREWENKISVASISHIANIGIKNQSWKCRSCSLARSYKKKAKKIFIVRLNINFLLYSFSSLCNSIKTLISFSSFSLHSPRDFFLIVYFFLSFFFVHKKRVCKSRRL